ncbi:MAG: hypothetical protein KGD64_01515 [Candidatus Heimdallarchaeota archaeon]|nr:hypothetical protein [Candidatus Heimdallarchaeota archaeon]
MGRQKYSLLLLLLCFSFYYSTDVIVAAKNYTIDAQDSIILTYEESSESVVILYCENYEGSRFHVEIKNLSNMILASRYNYTQGIHLSFIKEGEYTITLTNPNNEEIEIKVEQNSFPVVMNSNIEGYSHNDDLYCWSFNSVEESYGVIFPISTIKLKYYELFFIVENIDVSSNIWLSYENPITESDWADHLDPISYSKNGKVSVKVEDGMNWLITDLSIASDYDVLVILYDAPVFTTVGKVLVGIAASGAAIALLLVYYDPLKFRKRKVDGKSYDKIKSDYESTENMSVKVKELFNE